MNVIGDVTRAFPGTVSHTLDRVIRYATGAFSMTVIIYEDQLAEVQMARISTVLGSSPAICTSASWSS